MVEVLNHPPLEYHFYDCQGFVITTFCPIFTILQVDYHHLLPVSYTQRDVYKRQLRRSVSRPVSYYALFEWWLLLSQHPGCL